MKLSQRNKMKLVSTSIGLMLCSSLLYSNCSPQGFQTLNPVSGTTLASSSGSGGSPGGGNPPDTGSGGTPAGAGSGMPTPTPPPPMGGGNPPPASGGTPTAPITQFATIKSFTAIGFTITANWTYGTYAYRIEDANSSVPALEGRVNQPEIQWMVGTPSSEDVMEAPAHQMYDCGAELGGKLRIFGKN